MTAVTLALIALALAWLIASCHLADWIERNDEGAACPGMGWANRAPVLTYMLPEKLVRFGHPPPHVLIGRVSTRAARYVADPGWRAAAARVDYRATRGLADLLWRTAFAICGWREMHRNVTLPPHRRTFRDHEPWYEKGKDPLLRFLLRQRYERGTA